MHSNTANWLSLCLVLLKSEDIAEPTFCHLESYGAFLKINKTIDFDILIRFWNENKSVVGF